MKQYPCCLYFVIYSAEDSEEVSLVSEEVSEDSALLSSEEALSSLLSEATEDVPFFEVSANMEGL